MAARNSDGDNVVLRAENITKDFQEAGQTLSVLKGCSLAVARGEVVSLEGPSGSGKTTLLSIMGCILTASGGQLSVEGDPVDAGRPELLPAIRRRSIGFVFQQYNLIPALSALENIQYALNIKGMRGAESRVEAERALAEVGLAEKAHVLPRNLSGGQKQRVAIARAIAGRSPALLVDEPTANLDSQTGDRILELFQRLARSEGCGMLIVTHDPRVRAIADRVVTIRDGYLCN
jgi:putative ABC transport system ATP-binding protein